MDKTYNPQRIENHWYQHWETSGYFLPQGNGPSYCIMLPPPNVTGTLHMGHGFQVSLMDALIRYHRMCGDKTLWQVGTDHAGIATQMVVERALQKQGKTRHELGRDAFVEQVWRWKNQSDGTIKSQLRRMGASFDWSRERFSLDSGISRAVVHVFLELHRQGLIYRGKRLVNWDPVLGTAISDLEVVSQEEAGFLWYIRYPIEEGGEHLIVATTRPETLLGDTAVAVHPEDERYHHLMGRKIRHPLTERLIPIIADTYVDPAFGTGCVKITPAHDFNDYAIGQRHNLEVITIFTPDAHINDQAPKAYQGLERYQARERIIDDLKQQGLLEKIEPHTLQVPRGDRSGVVIEPYLTDQWYIKTKPLAEAAIAAVQSGAIQFTPENWRKTYYQWLEHIEDWCISRQLWWGHRIPAWYDPQGNVYVGTSEADVRNQYQLAADLSLEQDPDVLDTWFSASLWPFATLGWPEATSELSTFYPTHVLVTGFDILFFWVARMVMMGLKFTGQVPFRAVYVTGLVRDSEGQKMSKSKGNILDPIDLVDGIDLDSLLAKRTHALMQPDQAKKIAQQTRRDFPSGIPAFGVDALRFTYCALASTGRDIRFDLGRVEGYRNFCNKLWNAARYVLMNTESVASDWLRGEKQFSLADRWIQSRLQQVIEQVHHYFQEYRFDLLAQVLYEFIWNEYCDWYLEFSKTVLTDSNPARHAEQRGTRFTLVYVLETALRLLHPLMPFITEEIWQTLGKLLEKQGDTIMLQPYPQADATHIDVQAVAEVEWLKKVILSLRQIRGEMKIPPNKTLALLLKKGNSGDRERVQRSVLKLQALAKITQITWLADDEPVPAAAAVLVDQLELFIPLAGVIDQEAEKLRLQKELNKWTQEYEGVLGRLNNPNYLAKAPAAVVAKEQLRAQELQGAIEKLRMQQEKL